MDNRECKEVFEKCFKLTYFNVEPILYEEVFCNIAASFSDSVRKQRKDALLLMLECDRNILNALFEHISRNF